ncbi:unnamed protein product [Penicillium bialowiezense]
MNPQISFGGLNYGSQVAKNYGTINNSLHPARDLDERLPMVHEALFDSFDNRDDDECLPGTRIDILRQIQEWGSSPQGKSIFWLNGMAGTGKSTISRTIAKSFNQAKLLGASFFFKRGEGDRGNSMKLFSTIARQLAMHAPGLATGIRNAIHEDPGIAKKALGEQFDKLIFLPLLNSTPSESSIHNLIIVIDALDECERQSDIRLILQLLPQLQRSTTIRLKVFLTSRPEIPIRLGFRDSNDHQGITLHELPNPVIEHDIRLFLQHRLKSIGRVKGLEGWPSLEIIDTLVEMAVPLFIFAATICRFVEKGRHTERLLQRFLNSQAATSASQMDQFYLPVLNQLLDGCDKYESEELINEFHAVVGTIIVLATPLSVASLSHFLGIPQREISELLDPLYSVLRIPPDRNTPVHLLHMSFRDYLLSTEHAFHVDQLNAHQRMAVNCIRLMSDETSGLRQNICHLDNDGILQSEIGNIDDHISPELKYACRYWVKHLQDGHLPLDECLIYRFLTNHFLHWLEVMSILGLADGPLEHLASLQELVSEDSDNSLAAFLADAFLFLQHAGGVINLSPLQVYSSALIFAPHGTLVRKMFGRRIPSRYVGLPRLDANWGALLHTIQVPYARPDILALGLPTTGHLVAFVVVGQKTFTMYDFGRTGSLKDIRPLFTIPDDIVICCSTISPDGRHIAAIIDSDLYLWTEYDESPVLLWPDTGFLTALLFDSSDMHILFAKCLVFSGNSKRLAMATPDAAIYVWDISEYGRCVSTSPHIINTGSVIKDFGLMNEGRLLVWWTGSEFKMRVIGTGEVDGDHLVSVGCAPVDRNSIACLACSQDGYKVVLGVQVWDVRLHSVGQNNPIRRLWKPSFWNATKLEMSPDGRWVVGLDHTRVLLWDSHEQDMVVRPFQKKSPETCREVTFSSDSSQLACELARRVVQIWNLSKIELDSQWERSRDRLLERRETFTSIALSSDGQTLACYTGKSKSVRVWSMGGISPGSMTLRWSKKVSPSHLGLSPDGRLLAIAYLPGRIVIWDTEYKTVKCTIKGQRTYGDRRKTFSYSSDGQMLAACEGLSGSGVLSVWDITESQGKLLYEFEIFDKFDIGSIAFAPNNRYLVAALSHNIKVFDLITGTHVRGQNRFSRIRKIGFFLDHARILTELGSFLITPDELEEDTSVGAEIKFHSHLVMRDDWIVSGSRRHLCVPREYQGEWDSNETSLFVVTEQGQILGFLLRGNDKTEALGDNDRATIVEIS